ncbi:MAG: relaxase/mobilization nuclease domain-containing protein [Acutalibacteraceae bacterium]|nr:relaxase/mobilization nuclease domain-containing protein [Acutalibacteraceae bacterium]
MKNEASLIIIRNRHNGDTVIENVLNYVLSSPFAELDEVMVNGLTLDYYKMVEEFYEVQKPYSELDSHRRLFHMVLSARHSKHMQRTLEEAAKYFLCYMTMKDHQVLLVPHYGSEDNAYNYHWHAVVNVKSYSTGQTLLDKYTTYKEICDYLSKHQGVYWNYKYHTDKRIVASQYF